jgi:uncharacterized protein
MMSVNRGVGNRSVRRSAFAGKVGGMSVSVENNPAESRYELRDDGQLAALAEYRRADAVVEFTHTETLDGFGGRGLASQLIQAALDDTRQQGAQVRPYCPFVRRYISEHQEYLDLVPSDERGRFGF